MKLELRSLASLLRAMAGSSFAATPPWNWTHPNVQLKERDCILQQVASQQHSRLLVLLLLLVLCRKTTPYEFILQVMTVLANVLLKEAIPSLSNSMATFLKSSSPTLISRIMGTEPMQCHISR